MPTTIEAGRPWSLILLCIAAIGASMYVFWQGTRQKKHLDTLTEFVLMKVGAAGGTEDDNRQQQMQQPSLQPPRTNYNIASNFLTTSRPTMSSDRAMTPPPPPPQSSHQLPPIPENSTKFTNPPPSSLFTNPPQLSAGSISSMFDQDFNPHVQ